MTAIYSARWVLPIISPAIDNGAVAVDKSEIAAVGPKLEIVSRFPDARVSDFGEAAILPGLVNAHSHLELTVMRGFLEAEEHDFFAWLRKLTLARMGMTPEDLRISAKCGAIEAARAGITCMGDSSSSAAEPMRALRETGLRGIVYQESFGPDPNSADGNVAKLRDQVGELRRLESNLVRTGVSPHAPYTVSAPQLELISRLAIDDKLPVMMHAAEAKAEQLFMMEGRGPFADGLKRRGIDWQPPGISAIQYLARHAVLETKPLLAHCVTVSDADIELIRQSGAGIAHCPKSNAKLGHGRAPFAQFVAQETRVGLGSDSVASNNTCDILEEARFATLLARLPSATDDAARGELRPANDLVNADDALFAATLGGARALGMDNQIGALADSLQADIVVIGLNGAHQQPMQNPTDALIFSSSGGDVLLTIVAGEEIYRNDSANDLELGRLRSEMRAIRVKLDSLAFT